MAKKKYIKDSRGMTVSVTTETLGLEKPLLNENYDIDVHNRNMDKIDEDLTPIDDSYIIELFQHDGDTSNPIKYYTKEEADEKFATKEEVENIDLSNLATKEEVQGNTNLANQALNKANEAFQRGGNVKTQLVDKLISEGLDVSTNNTFEELIDSIALGKKWATGLISDSLPCYLYSPYAYFYVSINSLGFKPSTIMLCGNTGSNTRRMFYTEMIDGDSMYVWLNTSSTYMTLNISSTANGFFKISNGSFCMPLYYLQVSSVPNIKPVNTRWIAIE